MKTLHTKSSCCKAKAHRFGQRRRQCSLCKKTWRIRKKKRGRKIIRIQPALDLTVFKRKESLRSKAKRLGQNRETIRRRHKRNLELLLKKFPEPVALKGRLIAVIDGWCTSFKNKRYVVYLVLLRSVKDKYVSVRGRFSEYGSIPKTFNFYSDLFNINLCEVGLSQLSLVISFNLPLPTLKINLFCEIRDTGDEGFATE